jgi:hypothetical protein
VWKMWPHEGREGEGLVADGADWLRGQEISWAPVEREDVTGRSGCDRRGKGTRTKNNPTQEQIDNYI